MKKLVTTLLASYFELINYVNAHLVNAQWLKMENNFTWVTMFNYLKFVAYSLTIVYFIIECNRRWAIEGNDISMKSVAAPFVKLMLAVAIISNIGAIANGLIDGTNAFITDAAGWVSADDFAQLDSEELANQMYENCGGSSLFFLLFFGIFSAIFGIVAIIIMLGFTYKAICFQIEFWFRMGFTSIACADVYSGTNSQAMRWLKSCVGFALYGASLVILPTVVLKVVGSSSFIGSFEDEVASTGANFMTGLRVMAMYAISPIVAFGMIGTVRQVTKEVMG